MADPASTFKQFAEGIRSVGSPVTSEEVRTYGTFREIEDNSLRLRTILSAWESQQTQERRLRSRYAFWLLLALFLQIVTMNICFTLIGLGILSVDRWIASTFVASVFTEITGMTFIVVRYLFPHRNSPSLLDRIDSPEAGQ